MDKFILNNNTNGDSIEQDENSNDNEMSIEHEDNKNKIQQDHGDTEKDEF